MRLSRWGRSPYETDAQIRVEAEALSALVDVCAPGEDAEFVVVHSKIPFGPDEIARAPSLQVLITTTSGTDHLDLPALASHSVKVARLPLVRRDAVVETALMMMLWGLRGIGPLQTAAGEGRWARGALPTLGMGLLGGARVGLVGLGVIGQHMAQVLSALDVVVLGADPRGVPEGVEEAPLPALLQCDVLSLHCDLNPTSRGIIGPEALAAARPDLVLVNTARGGLVDEQVALRALTEGRLGALCLDVYAEEPWAGLSEVTRHPRLLALPHAAGFHTGLSRLVREGLVAAVGAWLQGEPLPHAIDGHAHQLSGPKA